MQSIAGESKRDQYRQTSEVSISISGGTQTILSSLLNSVSSSGLTPISHLSAKTPQRGVPNRENPLLTKVNAIGKQTPSDFYPIRILRKGCRNSLAKLGVTVQSLEDLSCGYDEKGKFWAFPELDSKGEIVGINRRYRDGKKRQIKGGRRGIYFNAENLAGPGPIYIVEGASDTAVGLSMGIRIIGRPSNFGGFGEIAQLLKPIIEMEKDVRIIVLGENDEKPDGRWPGREGAIKAAKYLAENLRHPVEWALSPDASKDIRAWWNDQNEDTKDWGQVFLSLLDSNIFAPPDIYEVPEPEDPVVDLQIAREQNIANMQRVLEKPGIYHNPAQTGIGKSTAMLKLIAEQNVRSMITVATHRNAIETVDQLRDLGVSALLYPRLITPASHKELSKQEAERFEINCWNEEATLPYDVGFSPAATVCQSCKFKASCSENGYLAEMAATKIKELEALAVVPTHKRVSYKGFDHWSSAMVDCDTGDASDFALHVVEEDAANVLRACLLIQEFVGSSRLSIR